MLTSKLDMKDIGLTNVILGMRIYKNTWWLNLSQCHYIQKNLDKFKEDENSIIRTSVDVNLHLSKNTCDAISQVEYLQIIKSLMFLMNCIKPNITYIVNKPSRYTSNPGKNHWKAITRVLRYLRYSLTYRLHCTRYLAILEGDMLIGYLILKI
jgi:hypothetical protein